jgi:hypothetical protein
MEIDWVTVARTVLRLAPSLILAILLVAVIAGATRDARRSPQQEDTPSLAKGLGVGKGIVGTAILLALAVIQATLGLVVTDVMAAVI